MNWCSLGNRFVDRFTVKICATISPREKTTWLCIWFRSRWLWMWDLFKTLWEGTVWQKSAWSLSRGLKKISPQETSDGNKKNTLTYRLKGWLNSKHQNEWHIPMAQRMFTSTATLLVWNDKNSLQFLVSSSPFSLCVVWRRMLGIRRGYWDSQRKETLYTIETQHHNMTLLHWMSYGH